MLDGDWASRWPVVVRACERGSKSSTVLAISSNLGTQSTAGSDLPHPAKVMNLLFARSWTRGMRDVLGKPTIRQRRDTTFRKTHE